MNRIATTLLGLTALVLVLFGIERIVYWVSLPLGPVLGGGEMFGTAFGVVILGSGLGVGAVARAVWRDRRSGWILTALSGGVIVMVSYISWSTPGPPPLPIPLVVVATLVGLALVGLTVARATGRSAP